MVPICARPRNAAATRQAIQDAAVERFSQSSYDDVGMRDIARDVGVDPALIVRYFGSKEELFSLVLEVCKGDSNLMEEDRAAWGRKVANEVVFDDAPPGKMRALMIILRSIGSARAMEVVRAASQEKFYGPFEAWIGGEDAPVKARLAGGLIMGMTVGRETTGGAHLSAEHKELLRDRLAATLQAIIDA